MKMLLYSCKARPYLIQGFARPMHTVDRNNPFNYNWGLINYKSQNALNGKVVAECDFEVEEIFYSRPYNYYRTFSISKTSELLKKSCLNLINFNYYLGVKKNGIVGYAIHIKNLRIFDEPKELNEYYKSYDNSKTWKPITKAPQNMMYVDYINIEEDKFIPYILVSIHPKYLCKILNGEKTIEIRKKVLKEMLDKEELKV